MNKHRVMSSQVVSVVLIVGMLLAAGLACGSAPKDARQAPPEYVGAWKGSDGSTITIRGDGGADYVSGGTTVTGGKALVSDTDKTLSITVLGIGPTLKIDSPPANDQMKLDAVVYKKSS